MLYKKIVSVVVFALIFLLILLSLCVASLLRLQTVHASPYWNIDVNTAYNMVTNGSYPDLVVLDVRTKSEYDSEHVYGAIWIPHSELEARIDELASYRDHEIIVYCRSGTRSKTASAILDTHNFTKVYNMLGGISAWKTAGYPTYIATVHNVNTTFNYDTIQAAIDAHQTLNGHVIFVNAGIYYEHVVVNKSITLIGENKSTTIIDGNYTGNVIEVIANDVRITGFTIRNSHSEHPCCGVFIDKGIGNNISYNIITNNFYAIGLWGSSNNSICQNNITRNNFGVLLNSSSNNIISGNNLTHNLRGVVFKFFSNNNTVSGNNIRINDFGVWLYRSSNNTLSRNKITNNNYDGAQFTFCSDNVFSGNEIVANNHYGIRLDSSSNNIFYHNNFIDNTKHIHIDLPVCSNIWDNGYPSGGNYWSNYTGVDLYSGLYQNETGIDGIGDISYSIYENNKDNYPLMAPRNFLVKIFNVVWEDVRYSIVTFSNSTVTHFIFSQTLARISFNVTGPSGSIGYCNVSIPKNFLRDNPWKIRVDDILITDFIQLTNDTHTFLYLTYPHTSTCHIIIEGTWVIQEFSSTVILSLYMLITAFGVIIARKRL